jgi:hypothetical protein
MYRLEYITEDSGGWKPWKDGIEDRSEAISLLYSAQVADSRDNINRGWRVSPNPWEAGE